MDLASRHQQRWLHKHRQTANPKCLAYLRNVVSDEVKAKHRTAQRRRENHSTNSKNNFVFWERTSLEPKWPDVRSEFPAASLSNQPVEPAPKIVEIPEVQYTYDGRCPCCAGVRVAPVQVVVETAFSHSCFVEKLVVNPRERVHLQRDHSAAGGGGLAASEEPSTTKSSSSSSAQVVLFVRQTRQFRSQ